MGRHADKNFWWASPSSDWGPKSQKKKIKIKIGKIRIKISSPNLKIRFEKSGDQMGNAKGKRPRHKGGKMAI